MAFKGVSNDVIRSRHVEAHPDYVDQKHVFRAFRGFKLCKIILLLIAGRLSEKIAVLQIGEADALHTYTFEKL